LVFEEEQKIQTNSPRFRIALAGVGGVRNTAALLLLNDVSIGCICALARITPLVGAGC